jgi:hypothetical protein
LAGLNWFKRVYVTSSSWENEQTIFQDGNNIRVNGVSKYNRVIGRRLPLLFLAWTAGGPPLPQVPRNG